MSGARPLRLAALALLAASLGAAGPARGVEGLPGSTWGDLAWDLPSPGREDLVLEGWVRQGVAWAGWSAGSARLVLQTYGTVRYRWDSLGLEWNNVVAPGVGVAVDLTAPRMPVVTAGVEVVHRWTTRSGAATPSVEPFLDWYHWWDLQRGRWPGATWGDVRWELPSDAREDLVAEGWVRQGWELRRWRAGARALVLGPYLRVRYKVDTLGLDWNNHLGPAVGVGLDLDGVKGLQPGIAVEYGWDKNLTAPGGVHRVELVVRWYGWWDLARR